MNSSKVCLECGGKMIPARIDKTFHMGDKEIEIRGLSGFKCERCGEVSYNIQDAKMIQNIINALNSNNEVDVLNLEETAEFLRVSNQTVYNMIKDGRLKAHKVGREWRFVKGDILAYMNAYSNESFVAMAAKGGKVDVDDLKVIQDELKERESSGDK